MKSWRQAERDMERALTRQLHTSRQLEREMERAIAEIEEAVVHLRRDIAQFKRDEELRPAFVAELRRAVGRVPGQKLTVLLP